MKMTLGRILLLCGIPLIVLPPTLVYAVWYYAVHVAPRTDAGGYGDLIGFIVAPLAILTVGIGVLIFVAGLSILLVNRVRSWLAWLTQPTRS